MGFWVGCIFFSELAPPRFEKVNTFDGLSNEVHANYACEKFSQG
jgi:hypothetical protein